MNSTLTPYIVRKAPMAKPFFRLMCSSGVSSEFFLNSELMGIWLGFCLHFQTTLVAKISKSPMYFEAAAQLTIKFPNELEKISGFVEDKNTKSIDVKVNRISIIQYFLGATSPNETLTLVVNK